MIEKIKTYWNKFRQSIIGYWTTFSRGIRQLLIKYWVKFLIAQLKKGVQGSETAVRILVHYTLLKMQETKSTEIEIEYEAPEVTTTKLIIRGKLVDINGNDVKDTSDIENSGSDEEG